MRSIARATLVAAPVPAFAAILAAALMAAPLGSAGAQERFAVEGTNPDSTKVDYTGEVEVRKTGETWNVVWKVGGDPIEGTGIIMDGTHAAVAGLFEGRPFVFILRKDGAKFVGMWTTAGGTKVGREVWTPK